MAHKKAKKKARSGKTKKSQTATRPRGRPNKAKGEELRHLTVDDHVKDFYDQLHQMGVDPDDPSLAAVFGPQSPESRAAERERTLIHIQRDEESIARLAEANPRVRAALEAGEESWIADDPETRLAKKNALINGVLFADFEDTARMLNQPPPFRPSFSLNKLNEPADEPDAAELVGGRVVNESKLYRAFAILMDLMDEVTYSELRRAKPGCVPDTAQKFIELMDTFVAERAPAASRVKARQMLPRFTEFYTEAKANWPPCKELDKIYGDLKLPTELTNEQQTALERQEAALKTLLKSFGYDPERPEVKSFVTEHLVAGEYVLAKEGSQRVAADAVGKLTGLDGASSSGSSIEHYDNEHTHIGKSAAVDSFRFFLADNVPVVGAADVLGTLVLARRARAYYLRYLIEEEIRRTPTEEDELSSQLFTELSRTKAAVRLGLPPSAYNPDWHTGSVAELGTWLNAPWGQKAIIVKLGNQGKPFNFGLMRKDNQPADAGV